MFVMPRPLITCVYLIRSDHFVKLKMLWIRFINTYCCHSCMPAYIVC